MGIFAHYAIFDVIKGQEFPVRFAGVPFVANRIFYKLLTKKYYGLQTIYLLNNLMKKNSEAIQVSRKIFETANQLMINNGEKFVLIIVSWRGEIKIVPTLFPDHYRH